MKVTPQFIIKDATKRFEEMLKNGRDAQPFFARVLIAEYRQAQIDRWNTENRTQSGGGYRASEPWRPLNKTYKEYKLKKFVNYPYSGSRMMVATGKLLRSTVEPLTRIQKNSIEFYISKATIPYAAYAAHERPIMRFDQVTRYRWKEMLRDYIRGIK